VDFPRSRREKGRHQENQIKKRQRSSKPRRTPPGFLFASGNFHPSVALNACHLWEAIMGRGLILWLLGIPLPIIILLALFGFFR
jgi:hypothetical protein